MPGIIVNIIWTAPGCPLEALCSLVQPRSLSGESRGSPGKPLWTCKSIEGITSPWTRSESAPPIGSINCRQSLILQARTINNQAIYAVLVGAVGIENNADRNFKDLKEMMRCSKALKRNNEEGKGILNGPSMAPRFPLGPRFCQCAFRSLSHSQSRFRANNLRRGWQADLKFQGPTELENHLAGLLAHLPQHRIHRQNALPRSTPSTAAHFAR